MRALRRALSRAWASGLRKLDAACFAPVDPRPLEAVRIGVAVSMGLAYLGVSHALPALLGEHGWLPFAQAAPHLDAPGVVSVFEWVRGPGGQAAVHAGFLAVWLAYALGAATPVVKWLAWWLHLSWLHRNPSAAYGIDSVAASLLFLLALAPVGRRWSVDAWWRRRRSGEPPPDLVSGRGRVCRLLLRWQMALILFFAAAAKLRGTSWWEGEALWWVAQNWEYRTALVHLLAWSPVATALLTWGALLVELAYPFLVWPRQTRAAALALVIGLHVGIALGTGLWAFQGVMIAGHLAFLPARASGAAAPRRDERGAPSLRATP